MNIIEAIHDEKLFRPYLGNLKSWRNWVTALRALHGLPIKKVIDRRVVRICTGRKSSLLPDNGFQTALFLTGRRSGKSRIAGLIGAFESVLSGREKKLSKGEIGCVAIISPTRLQSNIVKSYLRAVFDTPMLQGEIVKETKDGFLLRNGVEIKILVSDFRSVRGYTLLSAIVDEIAFMGLTEESKVKSDTELIRAIKPSLATTGGKLIAISSPYAKKGWCYQQWKRSFGNDDSRTLVWNCSSRMMNKTLPQSVVDDAMEEDLASAKAEFLGEFRDDIGAYLPRSVIESCVIQGRKELVPNEKERFHAFVDLSGGRIDDAAIAIAHRKDRKVIIDFLKTYRPPFSPHQICCRMSEEAKRYGVRKVVGDNYSAEFTAKAFEGCGLRYVKSEKNKSQLYLELLPRLCSGEIELLDDEVSINQLASLERRTRSGGRDIVDHPSGAHDDSANAIAGVSVLAANKHRIVGALGRGDESDSLRSVDNFLTSVMP